MQKTSGFFTANITDFSLTDKETIGIQRSVFNKTYRWDKNSTTTTLTVGAVYTFGTAATGGYFTEIFTFGQSAKGTSVNGLVVVAVSAIPAGSYGWVQEGGEVNASIGGVSGSNVAEHDNLKPVSGQTYLSLDTAGGTAPTAVGRPTALAAGNASGTVAAVKLNAFA